MIDFLNTYSKYLERSNPNKQETENRHANSGPKRLTKEMARNLISFPMLSFNRGFVSNVRILTACIDEEFLKLPKNQKISEVQKHQLCFNCMKAEQQNKEEYCWKCTKHNMLLHREQSSETSSLQMQYKVWHDAFGGTITKAMTRPRGETSGVVLPGRGASSPRYYSIYIIDAFFLFYHIVLQVRRDIAMWRNGWQSV